MITKKRLKELKEEKEFYEKLARDWENSAQRALKVAKEIAETRDFAISNYKRAASYRLPMKTREEKDFYEVTHYCPVCGNYLGTSYNKHKKFCDECGQALIYKEEK